MDSIADLFQAAQHNDAAFIAREHNHRHDVDCTDALDRTPLHIAADHQHSEAATALLSAGAKVNCTDFYGNTPLHLACCRGASGVVSTLLKAGASVDIANSLGRTPLHSAVLVASPETVRQI